MTLAAKATILAILAVGLTIVVQLWPHSSRQWQMMFRSTQPD